LSCNINQTFNNYNSLDKGPNALQLYPTGGGAFLLRWEFGILEIYPSGVHCIVVHVQDTLHIEENGWEVLPRAQVVE